MLDNIQRSPQQFLSNIVKNPEKGALKITADVLDLVVIYYFTTEHKLKIINEF